MITDFEIKPFTLRLLSSFKEKKGLLLYAKTDEGKEAWSEVSPLPGFSTETLTDALYELSKLKKRILDGSFSFLSSEKLLPSVAFGLDSLFYMLNEPLKEPILSSYPICALLSGSFEKILSQIPMLLEDGYQTVKLKVSQLSSFQAHHVIDQLLGKVKLKIDVNKAWATSQSLSFFNRYPVDTFEYIEEPVPNIKDLSAFAHPVALDETLRSNAVIPSLPQIKALILKPMLSGSATQAIIDASRKIGAKLILSSSYESGIGLFHLCSLIWRYKIPIHPLGVDPYRFLKEDILVTPHTISNGILTLSSPKVNYAAKPFLC